MAEAPARHLLSICTTCRPAGAPAAGMREGLRLLEAVAAAFAASADRRDLAVQGVECMSGCDRACTVALSAPGKPSYLFGDKRADAATAEQALTLLVQYRDAGTGVLLRGERPELFRGGILARLPAAPIG